MGRTDREAGGPTTVLEALRVPTMGLAPARLGFRVLPKETLAKRLKIAIAHSDLKDKEVAERAHVTSAWLGAVKQGHLKNPPQDKLRAVAKVLDVPTSYFTSVNGYIPAEEATDWAALLMADERLPDQFKWETLERAREDFAKEDIHKVKVG